MTYRSLHILNQDYTPGDRVWISGVEIAKTGLKLIRHIPPCMAELCCYIDPASENNRRSAGKPIQWAVPVLPDGSLDWCSAREALRIDIHKTKQEAVDAYHTDCDAAMTIINNKINALNDMLHRVADLKHADGRTPDV